MAGLEKLKPLSITDSDTGRVFQVDEKDSAVDFGEVLRPYTPTTQATGATPDKYSSYNKPAPTRDTYSSYNNSYDSKSSPGYNTYSNSQKYSNYKSHIPEDADDINLFNWERKEYDELNSGEFFT